MGTDARRVCGHLIYHVTTFLAHRTRADGREQEVRIDILDSGPGEYRFIVHARANDDPEDDAFATGNPGATVEDAISMVHWAQLDANARPPDEETH